MKKLLYILLLFPFLIEAQTEPNKILDEIYIGMTITEVKLKLTDYNFVDRPIYEYGMDSEEKGVLVKIDNDDILFLFKKYGTDSICDIMILSSEILVDGKIKVGDTAEKFLNLYENVKFELDVVQEEFEYAYFPNSNFQIEFITTDENRVCKYDNYKSIELIDIKRKIDRILVRK